MTNYAQWWSREDFKAIFDYSETLLHMREAGRLAAFEPQLYEVACSHSAG